MTVETKASGPPLEAQTGRAALRWLAGTWDRFGSGIILVLPALFLVMANPQFRDGENLINVLQQASIIGVIAIGQTMVLILGGFDLSVGAVAAMAGVATYLFFGADPSPGAIVGGIAGGLLLGALIGSANGFMIAKVRINPLIATLGAMSLVRGLVLIVSDGKLVYAQGSAAGFANLVQGRVLGVPVSGLIFLLVTVAGWGVLRLTAFGQSVYAIGGSERAALLSGIKVARIKVITYAACGLLAAVGGLMLATRTASALPNAATNYELQVITAAVIGGCSLKGGKGSIWGTVLGVLMLAVIANGLDLYGVSVFWQTAVTGVVLLIAVTLSAIGERYRTRGA
ncbi:ABC transporter permease [Actinomadura madurae]|uniref:Monosaccharide ABC transporter membrane protein, CUT2 family n=1 Tax=Actinomadura madurae TaxID=1993 RepID=A0A1I5GRH3_9ACTN|nr:ABC transporter permease [Actinomadura madurae]SFO38456.1 monosaccharide ABC transporter membrane protein, CUT2 family [Actinomadura madurae]SPT51475.1 Ribose transport system permease protein rbsC [Actinomadura madurae]